MFVDTFSDERENEHDPENYSLQNTEKKSKQGQKTG